MFVFFFQAEDGIRDLTVTGVQTCALPISLMLNPLGQREFPNINMLGGTFEGLPVIVSQYVGNVVALVKDRKSTRLNSSHSQISYAVFCLKKKKKNSSIKTLPNPTYYNEKS